jgi:hypothetical protein
MEAATGFQGKSLERGERIKIFTDALASKDK